VKLRLRTAAPFIAAFVAFVCALTVGYFAYEVSKAEAEVNSSDAAFRVERAPEDLWQVNGAAERVLGLKDDLAFRRAALLWDEAHRRSIDRSAGAGDAIAAGSRRAAAQLALAHAENEGLHGSARSKAANLEAVIVLQAALEAPANRRELLQRGLEGFRRAIRLDPTNEEAMLNLEFLLKILSTNPPPPLNQYGLAQLGQGIAGSTPGRTGHGY
jgi:triphosphoribosyl-dephospho-CoA synthetase